MFNLKVLIFTMFIGVPLQFQKQDNISIIHGTKIRPNRRDTELLKLVYFQV